DWLEFETRKNKEKFFATVQVGDEVEGKVKSFASFGAFIDLGGFDGLLHLNDMSWGHATRPKDYLKKSQTITLKVIKVDPEENKINLSLKHFTPDPWTTFSEKFMVNDIVKGRVTKLADFGAFIEIDEGIEGLAHISELSWVKKVNHPREILNIDDVVEAKILSFDVEKQRVSLGLKQVFENPWDSIMDQYPVGKELKRKVVKITNTGAFVALEDGIDGFIHVDDISWTKKYKNPSGALEEGEEYNFVIIEADAESRRIRLGMKQLSEDPWKLLAKIFKKGSIVEGEVTSITDFGIFVRVQGDIEGLIHRNDLIEKNENDDSDPIAKFPVGTQVKAVVVEINPYKKKLGLSIKEHVRRLQNEEISKYIHDEDEEGTVTFGDLLKHKENQESNT
ncbi:MAG: S1 RNA-binding domain-containing protein, partial [Spirochaetales bacterium]